ncbi:MAG: hypothetical protein ACXIU8_01075 [Alkalilacustris sp.]
MAEGEGLPGLPKASLMVLTAQRGDMPMAACIARLRPLQLGQPVQVDEAEWSRTLATVAEAERTWWGRLGGALCIIATPRHWPLWRAFYGAARHTDGQPAGRGARPHGGPATGRVRHNPRIARRAHHVSPRGAKGRGLMVPAFPAFGRALLAGRALYPSDEVFGQWKHRERLCDSRCPECGVEVFDPTV